jgi:uncharacterized protein YkwD
VKTKCGVVVLLVVMTALLFAAVPAPAPASVRLNSYEKRIVALINKQRAKHHLAKLRVNTRLVRAARSHSRDMGQRQYFAHNTLGAETWNQRLVKFGYTRSGCRVWRAGENIYYGSGLFSAPSVVVLGVKGIAQGWMTSPVHRRVILTRSFRDIGIGAVKVVSGDSTRWYFTLDLGRRIKG